MIHRFKLTSDKITYPAIFKNAWFFAYSRLIREFVGVICIYFSNFLCNFQKMDEERITRSAPTTPSSWTRPSYFRTFSNFSKKSTESERIRKLQKYMRIFEEVGAYYNSVIPITRKYEKIVEKADNLLYLNYNSQIINYDYKL
ncbi:hypothetical protein WA026_002652 [Henosepilachna vigintioctopunctata]|uniref:Uncharacterized protein n=1 Tax=Henosepilachna vigintioctopunctata TaxID=420089 RepID=A0AAW1TVE2_9CUCU